jgi:hypothetical protein
LAPPVAVVCVVRGCVWFCGFAVQRACSPAGLSIVGLESPTRHSCVCTARHAWGLHCLVVVVAKLVLSRLAFAKVLPALYKWPHAGCLARALGKAPHLDSPRIILIDGYSLSWCRSFVLLGGTNTGKACCCPLFLELSSSLSVHVVTGNCISDATSRTYASLHSIQRSISVST